MRKTLILLAVLAALIVPAGAYAAPWDGGIGVRSPIEQRLHDVSVAMFKNGGYEYICHSPEEWAVLGVTFGFDSNDVTGFVLPYERSFTHLSPLTCLGAERVAGGRRGSKECQVGETPVYVTETHQVPYTKSILKWVKVRVRLKSGQWRTGKVLRRVTVIRYRTVSEQVQSGTEPVLATCSDWNAVLFGIGTVSHESIHMLGISDEAVTECYGMQLLWAWVGYLTNDQAFSYEAGADYWAWYQANRPGTAYGHPECRPDGALDVSKGDGRWP